MTKVNRERLYLHYKDMADNYVAPARQNHGLEGTEATKERGKKRAAEMLVKNPELSELRGQDSMPNNNITPDKPNKEKVKSHVKK